MTGRYLTVTAFPSPANGASPPEDRDGRGWSCYGHRVALPLYELTRRLVNPFSVANKHAAPLFSPAVFRDDRRLLANVEACSMVVLDVDHSATLDEASAAFEGVAHILYTSFSHTPTEHRFRVVLPLSRDVDAATYRRLWRWASERLGGKADRQASDPSRLFFRYCRTPHAEHHVHVDRPLLDPDQIAPPEKRRTSRLPVRWYDDKLQPTGAPEGTRDLYLFQLACTCHRKGLDVDEALGVLETAALRCTPPFDVAEAQAKVRRVWERHGPPRRVRPRVLVPITPGGRR